MCLRSGSKLSGRSWSGMGKYSLTVCCLEGGGSIWGVQRGVWREVVLYGEYSVVSQCGVWKELVLYW